MVAGNGSLDTPVCRNDCSGVADLADAAARNTDPRLMQSTPNTTPSAGAATATQAKRLLPGLVAVAVVAGCATGTTVSGPGGPEQVSAVTGAVAPAPAVPQSGEASESRQVSGFTGVELTSIGDLHIEQTGTESLTIEADADVLPQLTSNVSHGVLELGVAPGTTISTSRPVVYRLTVATLNAVAVAGRGDVTVSDLRADRLTVEIDGAGDANLAGTVDTQTVTISGTGHYNGEDLQSAGATVTVDGAGKAVVRVSDRLDARVSGVGSVQQR